jgi:serine O-acetyltransferase
MNFWSRVWELVNTYRRYDPATQSRWEVLLLYPGVKAWVLHQLAHWLYQRRVPFIPRLISEFSRWLTGIEIHPGATIKDRVLMDHGHGIVIGETAVVEEGVLIYQGVTLGGTSLERSKRHPTIRKNCVLGSGAKVLGNIEIGEGTRIGSNSVVIRSAPAHSTVVGIPGRIVSSGVEKGHELEHAALPDPVQSRLQELDRRVLELEQKLNSSDARGS